MKRNRTILLVEDNPDDVTLALRAFHKSPVKSRIVVARDGVEALSYLLGDAQRPIAPELPAVVLLDLKLPKINGFEVLKRLRREKRTARLPVVVLTSSREDRDLDKVYRLGANSFICKPVNFDRFQQVVGTLGNYWLDVNEPPPLAKGDQ